MRYKQCSLVNGEKYILCYLEKQYAVKGNKVTLKNWEDPNKIWTVFLVNPESVRQEEIVTR